MTIRSDYTAALIDKDLYLLGAVFSSIEEEYISVLKSDIATHANVDVATITKLYHLTDDEVGRLHSYEKEYRAYLYTYIEVSMDRYRELRILAKRYRDESKKIIYTKIIGIILVISAVAYLFTITFFVIPPENVPIVNTIGGMVIGCTVQSLMQYFFPNNKKLTDNENNRQ